MIFIYCILYIDVAVVLIDFKEIPKANIPSGNQDTWEKFCRDFFAGQGYTILSEPTRGQDGGIDIKIKETKSNTQGI